MVIQVGSRFAGNGDPGTGASTPELAMSNAAIVSVLACATYSRFPEGLTVRCTGDAAANGEPVISANTPLLELIEYTETVLEFRFPQNRKVPPGSIASEPGACCVGVRGGTSVSAPEAAIENIDMVLSPALVT